MNAAIRQSRRTVQEFIDALQASPPKDLIAVKLRLAEGEAVEYVWLSSPTYADRSFHGRIDNDIQYLTGYKAGDSVSVHVDSIADWMYVEAGLLRGGYSVRLLAPQMSPEELAQFPFRMPPDSAWPP
jgi:uncharacterized protein YegJ (DUF2314 family)